MSDGKRRQQIMVVDDESDLTLFYRMSLEYIQQHFNGLYDISPLTDMRHEHICLNSRRA